MAQPYQLVANSTSIYRRADGAYIPDDPANRDYQEYLAWVAEGNTPDPAPSLVSATSMIAQSAQSLELSNAKQLAAQGRTNEAITALINIIEEQVT